MNIPQKISASIIENNRGVNREVDSMNIIGCYKGIPGINKYGKHSHPYGEIKLLVDGCTKELVGDKWYHINENDVVIIPPNLVHEGYAVSNGFSDWFIAADAPELTEICIVHDKNHAIKELMAQLILITTLKEPGYERISSLIGETICAYIRHYNSAVPSNPAVHALKNEMYMHIDDCTFELSSAIEKTGYCPVHLRRLFKKETGISPHAYLTNLRLQRAKELLIHENYSGIADVAAYCGFADSYYFSSCFHKHVGVPPLQYRKNHMASD